VPWSKCGESALKRTRQIPFSELRRLLDQLGFVEKATKTALVFDHPKEGLIVFRRYADDDDIAEHDIVSTRKFLDMRGMYSSDDFDGFLEKTTTSA
jgi:hypothetical protein